MDNRYGMRATILLFEQGHGSAKEEKLRGYLRHTSLFRIIASAFPPRRFLQKKIQSGHNRRPYSYIGNMALDVFM